MMQVYLLSKLVSAKPMRYSEWLQEQGDRLPDDLEDREGMYVLEDADAEYPVELWVPQAEFEKHFTSYIPH